MVGEDAVGLLFNGSSDNPTYGGVTKNVVHRIRGTFYDGDLLRFRYADNNRVFFLQGIPIAAGGGYGAGTGKAIRFQAVSTNPAHVAYGFPAGNIIDEANGDVLSEAHCHGNLISWHSSEGGSIEVEADSHLAYTALDYVTLALHETHRYTMTDELDIGAGSLLSFGDITAGEVAGWWGVLGMGDTSSSRLSGRVRPYGWGSGTVTHLRITFGMAGANTTDTVRFIVKAASVTPTLAAGTPPTPGVEVDVTQVVTVTDAATVVQYVDIQIDLAYTHANEIFFQVERTPTHGDDTAAGAVNVYGVTLLYASTGPTVTATTPYSTNPPPYSPISTSPM
jgi:hypothetical protein